MVGGVAGSIAGCESQPVAMYGMCMAVCLRACKNV